MADHRSRSNDNQFDAEVIIVGGGLSGLTCARKLQEKGIKVLVLEARDRLGGRTQTTKIGEDYIDIGGQWLGPTQSRMLKLVEEFKINTFNQYVKGKNLLVLNYNNNPHGPPSASPTSVEYTGLIPWIPGFPSFIPQVTPLLDIEYLMHKVDALAKQVPSDSPWKSPHALEWDSMTVNSWIKQNAWTSLARDLMEVAESRELSFLYFLYYVKNAGTYKELLDSETGAQTIRVTGGTQQFSEKIGNIVGMQNIKLNAPVRKITQHNLKVSPKEPVPSGTKPSSSAYVTVESDVGTFRAKYVVCAMTPALTGRILYEPRMPHDRDNLTLRFPMGSVIKTVTIYKEPWWRKKGYSGMLVNVVNINNVDNSESSKLISPCQSFFDDCDGSGNCSALLGFILGDAARIWASKTEDERKQAVIKQIATQFKSDEGLHPEGYVEKVWMNEEWSKGCYVGILGPGVLTSFGPALREPVGNIFWAGTETATVWTGYMEGAVEAGERVASEVLQAL